MKKCFLDLHTSLEDTLHLLKVEKGYAGYGQPSNLMNKMLTAGAAAFYQRGDECAGHEDDTSRCMGAVPYFLRNAIAAPAKANAH